MIGSSAAVWEGYKALWQAVGWGWPFPVNDTTMPHLYGGRGVLAADDDRRAAAHPLAGRCRVFTMKEAIAGFVLGAVVGFALAVVLAQVELLERGLIPFVVGSQTVPILAIAPMVVIGLG